MRFTSLVTSVVPSVATTLLAFGVLTYLRVPVGTIDDWVVAVLAFAWLATVTTVPWNVYFAAKAVLADAAATAGRGLAVDLVQVAYVRRLAAVSLGVAVGLHLASAEVLFLLARYGVARVGYAGAVVALLLTGLRPSAAAYRYLSERLHAIGQSWRYPAQDVAELRSRVDAVEDDLRRALAELDPDRPESVVAVQRASAAATRQALADASAEVAALRAANAADHDRLAREARSAVSQVSADGQVLDHVRELVRFFKSA